MADDDIVIVGDSQPAAGTISNSKQVQIIASWPDGHIPLLQSALLTWYDVQRRKLPWRGDPGPWGAAQREGGAGAQVASPATPGAYSSSTSGSTRPADGLYHNAYGTWVSEVMLQQTRVETVIPYWCKWMDRWPTVKELAQASEEEVNAAWAGLGFYRRARNLHKGARAVLETRAGELPRTVAELKEIPGIGDYTAGAIASIAYGLPAPLVDGNVVRVFSRLRGLRADAKSPALAKACWALASSAVPHAQRPGSYNQALMELGATVCTPKSPSCATCPVRATGACAAWQEGVGVAQAAASHGSSAAGTADIEDLGSPQEPKKKKQATLLAFSSFKAIPAPCPSPPPIPELPSFTPAQYERAITHIATQYPLKASKAASPTEHLACVLVVHEGRYLMVKKATSLLAGQWAPYAVSCGRVGGTRSAEGEEDGEEEEEQEENTGGGAKPATAPAARAPAKGTGKRSRPQEVGTAALASTRPGGSPREALMQGLHTLLGCLPTVHRETRCAPFTHVFSHVVHEVDVHRWEVALPPAEGGRAAGAPAGAHAVEHRWCTLEELEGLGLTTWTVKALHASLQPEYSAWAGSSSSSSSSGAGAGAGAGAGGVWPSLRARWKKAGCTPL